MQNPQTDSNVLANVDASEAWHLEWILRNPDYEERPVDIITFVNNPEYMNAKEECWDAIKDDLKGLFKGYDNEKMLWDYNEAVFDEGIGAGKSYKSSVIITYLLYRILII